MQQAGYAECIGHVAGALQTFNVYLRGPELSSLWQRDRMGSQYGNTGQ